MSEAARCPECGETLFQSQLAQFDRFFDGYLECRCGQLVPEAAKKRLPNKPTPTELPAHSERSLKARLVTNWTHPPQAWVLKIIQALSRIQTRRVELKAEGRNLQLVALLLNHFEATPESVLTATEHPSLHLRLGLEALADHPLTEQFELTWTSAEGVCGLAWRSGRIWYSPNDDLPSEESFLVLSLTRHSDSSKATNLFEPELSALKTHGRACPFSISQQTERVNVFDLPKAKNEPVRLAVGGLTSRSFPSFPTSFLRDSSSDGWVRTDTVAALLEVFITDSGPNQPCSISWLNDGISFPGDPINGSQNQLFWRLHLSTEGLDLDPARLRLQPKQRPPLRCSVALTWVQDVLLQLAQAISMRDPEEFRSLGVGPNSPGWWLIPDHALRDELRLAEETDYLANTRRENPVRAHLKTLADQLHRLSSLKL